MRRKIVSLVVVVFVSALSSTPVLASHGHHRRVTAANYPTASANYYSVCGIEDCTLAGLHDHDGTSYYSHYYGDGHDYHGYCNMTDCTIAGYHGHDGTYHFGHTAYDGHNYHRSGRGHH